jgi:hypothetical protein
MKVLGGHACLPTHCPHTYLHSQRKFKIMQHQIEQLKEEISAKDLALVKEHFDHMKVRGGGTGGTSCAVQPVVQAVRCG